MERGTRIPVKVRPPDQPTEARGASHPTEEKQPVEVPVVVAGPVESVALSEVGCQEELADWRERALRLQAEMDNYRKRQQKLAQDRIETERQRLLQAFLRVVDDLERALDAPAGSDDGLRQGVELTRRTALQLLQKEGVERLEAANRPFDPAWQEAVGTVAHDHTDAAPNTVVQVLEPGYRLGEHLLRPARVIVAV